MTKLDRYFKERFENQEKLAHRQMLARRRELREIYIRARNELESDLALFVQRYSTENGLTQAETRRMLNHDQLARFKYTIKGYIEEIDKLGIDTPEGKKLRKELDVLAGRTRVARVRELQACIDAELKIAALKTEEKTGKHMRRIISFAHEDGKRIFKANTLAKLNPEIIEHIVMQDWKGGNYSTNIWKDTQYLTEKVRENILNGLTQGHDFKRMSKRLAKDMDTCFFYARRVLESETTYALESTKTQLFKDLGVEQFKNIATLDENTSDICKKMNGTVFDVDKKAEGITAPPFHPFCRTVTVPVVNKKKLKQLQMRYK